MYPMGKVRCQAVLPGVITYVYLKTEFLKDQPSKFWGMEISMCQAHFIEDTVNK
jgi:hypothetical protein